MCWVLFSIPVREVALKKKLMANGEWLKAQKFYYLCANKTDMTMGNFLDLVEARYSARAYSDRKVEQEKIDYILECARLAPSAVNFQPWKFIIVESEEKRTALHASYAQEWLQQAPLYIVVCGDKSQSWTRKKDSHDHADIDAAIAASMSAWS